MRSEITTIIFSKNRACQLELLLRGLSLPASVLYTCDDNFRAGYDELKTIYPDINFVLEENFKQQLIDLIEKDKKEYIVFFVDDDVMVDRFDEKCKEFLKLKENLDILCLSLRLSLKYKGAPESDTNVWSWRGLPHSWGYPMSVSSHIFRIRDIIDTLKYNDFNNPHLLEKVLRSHAPNRPFMSCFDKPKIINNLANQVQSEYKWPNLNISLEELEKTFLNGGRLSLDYMKEVAKTATDSFVKVHYQWE